ncbi:hypothetical protein OUZ56_004839 [Daphnia magna]|uniref:Uncharacterized protein n=1 Tax=Daphnia magna TaxID=35525 RepID=A0ABQ9YR08_9CRUS|nr:hypothetical protein OUZ56_004839 [Daphnia magna]
MKGRLLHPNSCVVQHITVKPAKSAGMSQTIWEAVIGVYVHKAETAAGLDCLLASLTGIGKEKCPPTSSHRKTEDDGLYAFQSDVQAC